MSVPFIEGDIAYKNIWFIYVIVTPELFLKR